MYDPDQLRGIVRTPRLDQRLQRLHTNGDAAEDALP